MFDIGFWEILFTSVIGLLVLGPERLPGAIRSVLKVVRGVKNSVSQVTTELKQELEIDELHSNLKKAEKQGLESLNADLSESFETLKSRAESVTRPYAKPESQADTAAHQQTAEQNEAEQADVQQTKAEQQKPAADSASPEPSSKSEKSEL